MKGTPSCSKKSNTVTMFGWLNDADRRDSWMNRWTWFGSLLRRSSCLSATERCRADWKAS